MACIINIETSTDVCSVAVSIDGKVEWNKEDFTGKNAAERLGTYVDEALFFIDSKLIPLDAVSVSAGPGSYTGLRIGVSMAKGVCYGREVPLLSVPTLEAMCVPVLLSEKVTEEGPNGNDNAKPMGEPLLCPMIDARRMEVYAGIFNRRLKLVRDIQADIVTEETYRELLDNHHIYFFGNGAAKCMETINHPNAHLIEGIYPLAKSMMPLSERRLFNNETEDVAYFVPSYLKDYVAKLPKKLI